MSAAGWINFAGRIDVSRGLAQSERQRPPGSCPVFSIFPRNFSLVLPELFPRVNCVKLRSDSWYPQFLLTVY